jgi:hypothetical protein
VYANYRLATTGLPRHAVAVYLSGFQVDDCYHLMLGRCCGCRRDGEWWMEMLISVHMIACECTRSQTGYNVR